MILLTAATLPASALEYKRDIMPIFEAKCFDCHSDQSKKVKGNLRLDDPTKFLNRFSKNDVVIPGDWDASYLFVTITRPHEDKEAMPPKGKGDPLTPEEVMKVAQWIHEGAKVGRVEGRKGSKDLDPEKILKFKDGLLVTEQFGPGESNGEQKKKLSPGPRDWTNTKGKTITATFKELKGTQVHFILKNGRTALYPLNQLSEESQSLIKQLATQDK